jgi:hypothetical protein
MALEVLNSFRRSQHMGPLLDLPETTGKLGGRTILDTPAARKKAVLDSPSSSEEDSLDLSLSPLPEAGGGRLLDSSRATTAEAAILDIASLSIEQTWESMLDQSLEDDRIEQEELLETRAFSASNMPRLEDVLLDVAPNSLPPDEKVGDNAVDYSEDSHDEERSAPGQGQEGTLHSVVARQLAIEEVCATFDKSKGKHEAGSQEGMMGTYTAPVLNPTMTLRQTDIISLVENKDFRQKVPNIGHNPQRSGQEEDYLNDYGDTLAGYTSPGGSIRVHKEMMRLVFYAVAAELPNKAVLKAKQDAYD